MTGLSSSKLLGAMVVLAFIVILVALHISLPSRLDVSLIFAPPLLIPITATLFLSVVPFAVAYLSARSYLAAGSVTLLFLSVGMLAYGLGYLSSWLLDLPGGANIVVTIVNTDVLVGSIWIAVGVIFALAAPGKRLGKGKAILAYLVVLVFTAWLTIASLQGALPLFFIPGIGSTPLRWVVLGTAIGLFALSSVGVMRLYSESKSSILYWYGLAMALIAVGLAAFVLQRSIGDPIGWIGRLAQYLGGMYLLFAVLTALRGARAKGSEA